MKTQDAFVNFEQIWLNEKDTNKIAERFTAILNCCSGGPIEAFVEYFSASTIRQQLNDLFTNWIYVCADDEYVFDERNHASHVISKEIVKELENQSPNTTTKVVNVCKGIAKDHRTLQQNFTRLAVEWLFENGVIMHKAYLPYI